MVKGTLSFKVQQKFPGPELDNSPECQNLTVRKRTLDAAVSEKLVELKERAMFLRSESQTQL